MCKVAYVILHYESSNDTEQCLLSLLRQKGENYSIIIVDNGSVKDTIERLIVKYKNKTNVYFLKSKQNLGFANGNNIGYRFSKYELHSDIVVLCNSDLIFTQEEFNELLMKHYLSTEFDVAGPNIISLMDGQNQNPVPVLYKSIKDVQKRIIKYKILYFLSIFNVDKLAKRILGNKRLRYNSDENSDFQIHGACMIFANRYLKEYDGLYDGTFMYEEESILKYITIRDKMSMMYFDDICVNHKEGSSTAAVYGKGKKNRQFYYRWNIRSCSLLKDIMKGNVSGK